MARRLTWTGHTQMKELRHFVARALRRTASIVDHPNFKTVNISDEFANWLCWAVPGMQDRGNLYCFDYAIKRLPSQAPMIEVGSWSGLSTNFLNYYRLRNNKMNRLFTCDKWIFEGSERGPAIGDSLVTHAQYRDFIRENFLRSAKLFSRWDLPNTIEMTSDEFFVAWRERRKASDVFGRLVQLGGPVSFCYIDGNHSYDFVTRDFMNCDEHLEPGGFLLFDDSADNTGWEVCSLMAEIQRSGRYETVIKNPNYLFQKR